MEKLSYGQRVLPLIAIAQTPVPISLEDLSPSNNTLIIVLEALEKLKILERSCERTHPELMLLSFQTVIKTFLTPIQFVAVVVRVFHLPVISTSHKELMTWLDGHAFQSFATRIDGAVDYTQVDYTGKTALVMGTEATGLSERWNNEIQSPLAFPCKALEIASMSPQVVLSFAMKPCGNAVAPREIGRHTLHRVVSHSLNSGPSDWPAACSTGSKNSISKKRLLGLLN